MAWYMINSADLRRVGGREVDPGYGKPVWPNRPNQGLPGYGHPDQGLPGGPPDHTWGGVGGRPDRPDQGLPGYGHPDQGLPVPPYGGHVDNSLPAPPVGMWPPMDLDLPDNALPEGPSIKALVLVWIYGQGWRWATLPVEPPAPDQGLPPTAEPK